MSALTDVSNIIAAIKADILTALANRGATVSQATKLSEVSGLINNMVVQGSGDNIPATNMTGASIAVGDKVFLQENVAVEQTVTILNYTSSNDKHLLCSLGTKVLYGNMSYDIITQSTSSISDNPSSLIMAGNYPIYNSRGGMHVGYCLTTDGCENIAKLYAQDDYIVHWFSSGTSFTLSKVNENLEPIQSWTVSSISSYDLSKYAIVVIGDKL